MCGLEHDERCSERQKGHYNHNVALLMTMNARILQHCLHTTKADSRDRRCRTCGKRKGREDRRDCRSGCISHIHVCRKEGHFYGIFFLQLFVSFCYFWSYFSVFIYLVLFCPVLFCSMIIDVCTESRFVCLIENKNFDYLSLWRFRSFIRLCFF